MAPTGPSSFPFWRLAACLLVVIAACCPILYLNRQIAKSTNICIGLRDDSQLPAPCLELRFFGQTRVHNIWLWRYYVRSVFGFAAVFLVSFILYPVAQRLAATLRE